MASMAPGHRELDALGTIPDFHQHYPDPKFTGEVVYEDADGTRYREPIAFDFNYRKHVGAIRKDYLHDDLQAVRKELRDLTEAVKKVAATRGER